APTPAAPPPPAPAPTAKSKASAQEMMWDHFAESSSPPSHQPDRSKASGTAPETAPLGKQPFSESQETKAKPSLPPEQLAWGHFAQSEAPPAETKKTNFGFGEPFAASSQAQPPVADTPSPTAPPAPEPDSLSAGSFDSSGSKVGDWSGGWPATPAKAGDWSAAALDPASAKSGDPSASPLNPASADRSPTAPDSPKAKAGDWSGKPGDLTMPEGFRSIADPDAAEGQIYSDVSLAGPHYSFGTAFSLGHSSRAKRSPTPQPEKAKTEAVEPPATTGPSQASKASQPPFTFAPGAEPITPTTSPPPEIVEEVPDLDALDIFDDLDNLTEMEEIEIIEEVVKDQANQKASGLASTISGDELRELIKSRIKQASEQLAEPPAEVSSEQSSEEEPTKKASNRSKFVGAAKAHEPPKPSTFVPRAVPAEIRKACLLLGVRPEEITKEIIIDAWKRQIASPGVHPDLGGDTESAIFLNTAKDTLIRWLEDQAPKLGKRFGQTEKTRAQANPKKSSDKTDRPDKADKAKKAEKSE
ncbi:MAG: hypothetical protein C5B53_07975, partial [Candidatus Melainabacteria bacterium]